MPNEIQHWKRKEGLIRESLWLKQGIELYRKQIAQNPKDLECKASLAKLLIRSGTDEKIKYVNLLKAENLFKEVIEIDPNNAEALYRLGHINYENHDFEQSITYFRKAIKETLSDIRAFRAFVAMSKAYYYISDDEKALRYLHKAIENDKERNFTTEIQELERYLTQGNRYNRVVRYPDGIHQFITIEETDKLKEETIVDGEAELDVSHFHPTFRGPEGEVSLERKEAEILKYLIQRDQRYISKEELLNVWDEGEKPEITTIKTYISKIKRKLQPCFLEETAPIIHTKRGQGYRWICKIPTLVIKSL